MRTRGLVLVSLGLLFITQPTQAQNPPKGVLALPPEGYVYVDHPDLLSAISGKDFTIEAWFYFTDIPKKGVAWTLFARPDSYAMKAFTDPEENIRISYNVRRDRGGSSCIYRLLDFDEFPGKWIHIAFQVAGTGTDCSLTELPDGTISFVGQGEGPTQHPRTALYIGGLPEEFREPGNWKGWIDEVRISKSQRYSPWLERNPPRTFQVDKDTLALWHFDEGSRYVDATENRYRLRPDRPLSVSPRGKLATMWSLLRRN